MKKIIQLLFLSFVVLSLSCNKEEINNTDTNVGISRVTNFPILSLKGARYVAISAGSSYTEPGVNATESGTPITYTTSGTVNTSTPGIYNLTYTAVNKDGFAASLIRTVAVYSTDASAASNDFSGTYLRAATGVNSYWTKLAPGVYKVENPGGAATGAALVVIAFNNTGTTIKIPSQRSSDGNISSSSSETYTASPAPAKYSWIFNNPGYGTALRTFVKQ